MSEKTYEFRELCSKDIFPMVKILNKIGIREFKECFQSDEIKSMLSGKGKSGKGKSEAAVESIGFSVVFDIAGIILGNIPSCENEIYNMLSDVSNLSREEIEKMNMGTFAEMIVDFVKKPEFSDFIKVVSKLFK